MELLLSDETSGKDKGGAEPQAFLSLSQICFEGFRVLLYNPTTNLGSNKACRDLSITLKNKYRQTQSNSAVDLEVVIAHLWL